jgi:hypothetical protein
MRPTTTTVATLFLTCCVTLGHAFAPQPVFDAIAMRSRRNASSPRLHLFDPMSVHQHAMEQLPSITTASDNLSNMWLLLADAGDAATPGAFLDAPPEAGGISYSKTSYYTILALYSLSFPGLWSTIKRSTKAKVKRMTFVTPGENAPPTPVVKTSADGVVSNAMKPGLSLRQQAGEIMACTWCINGLDRAWRFQNRCVSLTNHPLVLLSSPLLFFAFS